MFDVLLSFLFFILGLILGFYLLLLGRRTMALTTAIVCLAGTGGLLALIFLGSNSARALTEEPNWLLLGIALVAGIIGGILGARAEQIAAYVVGFFAGGYMGLWFYEIAFYLVVRVAQWPENVALWVGVAIMIISGLVGLILTRQSKVVALILISVFVGTDLIAKALNLSSSRSMAAVIIMSLALLGLVVQYAQYLREIKVERHSFFAEAGTAPAPEYFDLSDDH